MRRRDVVHRRREADDEGAERHRAPASEAAALDGLGSCRARPRDSAGVARAGI